MDLFTTSGQTTARTSRYTATDGATAATTLIRDDGEVIGGRVYIGRDRAKLAHLVHVVNGAESALPVYAVATAVASGKLVPAAALVAAFEETGQLAKLARAVKAAQDAATAAATPKA